MKPETSQNATRLATISALIRKSRANHLSWMVVVVSDKAADQAGGAEHQNGPRVHRVLQNGFAIISQRIAIVAPKPGKPNANQRLQDHGRQREDRIRNHHHRRRARDECRIVRAMCHQHEEGDADSGAEDDDGTERVQIFDQEIQRHGFLVATGFGRFSARASSPLAAWTPASVSIIQWPSLPTAGSVRKSSLPPPLRNASANAFENAGAK